MEAILPQRVESILKSESRPTGIFCYNDEIAYMVLNIAKLLNLIIPRDISIIGFDDSELSKIMDPKLTSMTHPKEKMGRDAAKLIIKLIYNKNHFEDSDSYYMNLILLFAILLHH